MADPARYPGMPRWVKVAAILAAAILLAIVVLMLLSGGRHGPGRHLAPYAANAPTPDVSAPSTPPELLQSQPAGGRR